MADDHDDDPDLTNREKELKKWTRPYKYCEFPKMLYRGTTSTAGRVEVEQRIVGNAAEEQRVVADGWHAGPKEALEAETHRREARGAARREQRKRELEDLVHRVLDKREERRKKLAPDGSDEPDVDLTQKAQHKEEQTESSAEPERPVEATDEPPTSAPPPQEGSTAPLSAVGTRASDDRPPLKLAEAATRLGMSISTLKRKWKRGEITILTLGPKTLRVLAAEVDRALSSPEFQRYQFPDRDR